jgi:hypothetical protein
MGWLPISIICPGTLNQPPYRRMADGDYLRLLSGETFPDWAEKLYPSKVLAKKRDEVSRGVRPTQTWTEDDE